MRVSTHEIGAIAVKNIMMQQSSLSRIQEHVSTGKKIITPSDDPIQSGRLAGLYQEIKDNHQLFENMNYAENQLTLEESVLEKMTSIVATMEEKTIYIDNAGLNFSDVNDILLDMQGMLNEWVALANTKNESGDYIFAGSLATQPAVALTTVGGVSTYVYQGDENVRQARIHDSYTIDLGDTANAIFFQANILNDALQFITTVGSGGLTNAQIDTNCQSFLSSLDTAQTHMLTVRANIGVRLQSIDMIRDLVGQQEIVAKTFVSQIEDLNFAEAITQLESLKVALEAAQASFVQIRNLSLFNYL